MDATDEEVEEAAMLADIHKTILSFPDKVPPLILPCPTTIPWFLPLLPVPPPSFFLAQCNTIVSPPSPSTNITPWFPLST